MFDRIFSRKKKKNAHSLGSLVDCGAITWNFSTNNGQISLDSIFFLHSPGVWYISTVSNALLGKKNGNILLKADRTKLESEQKNVGNGHEKVKR